MFLKWIFSISLALFLTSCGGGGSDTQSGTPPENSNQFAQKIDYFPSPSELEENNQSIISFTFNVQGADFINIEINGMANCNNEDDTCVILVNNGANDLVASGDFRTWTGGLATVQCESLMNPICQVNLDDSGSNYAIGLQSFDD